MKCQICGKKEELDIEIVIENMRLKSCGECLNDWGNQDYDKLTKKLEVLQG